MIWSFCTLNLGIECVQDDFGLTVAIPSPTNTLWNINRNRTFNPLNLSFGIESLELSDWNCLIPSRLNWNPAWRWCLMKNRMRRNYYPAVISRWNPAYFQCGIKMCESRKSAWADGCDCPCIMISSYFKVLKIFQVLHLNGLKWRWGWMEAASISQPAYMVVYSRALWSNA